MDDEETAPPSLLAPEPEPVEEPIEEVASPLSVSEPKSNEEESVEPESPLPVLEPVSIPTPSEPQPELLTLPTLSVSDQAVLSSASSTPSLKELPLRRRESFEEIADLFKGKVVKIH